MELLASRTLSAPRAVVFLALLDADFALLAPPDLRLPPDDLDVARDELAPRDEAFDEFAARDLLELLREPDSLAPFAEDASRLLELAPRPRVAPRALAESAGPFDFEFPEDERRPDEARFEPRLDELR